MKIKEFKRLEKLLSNEESEQRASIYKLAEVCDDFVHSSYFINNDFKRGNKAIVLSQIEEIQAKDEKFDKKVASIKKSQRYKELVEQYKDYNTHYSMGEWIYVVFTDGVRKEYLTISDTEEQYRGNAKKYNYKIAYGKVEIKCDFSNYNRTKYSVIIKEKK